MAYDYRVKRTLAQAQAEVDSSVVPRECFVTHINNTWGYQSFSTTGDTPCAHYVAHQLNFKDKRSACCQLEFLVRVQDVVARLGSPIDVAEVKVGDVWARLKGAKTLGGGNEPTSHCGMVSAVKTSIDGPTPIITITHCSSGQRKLAANEWSVFFKKSGLFYRPPAVEKTAALDANLHRLAQGFDYQLPFYN